MKTSGDINQMFSAAEAAYAKGDGAKALALIGQIEPYISAHASILHLKGLSQILIGELHTAKATLSFALKIAPNDIQIVNNLANLLCDLKEYPEALILYDSALVSHPQFHEARLNRAIVLHSLKRFDSARNDFNLLKISLAGNARLWSAKGAMEFEAGEWETARWDFQTALKINPQNLVALAGLGKIALELGERESTEYYQAAHKISTMNLPIVIGLSHAKFQNGDLDAVDIIKPYLSDFPLWKEGHEIYSQLLFERGDIEHCTDYFYSAVTDNPENDDLRLSLCRVLAGRNRFDAAFDLLAARPKHLSQSVEISLMIASVAAELGNLETANAYFEQLPLQVTIAGEHARFYLKSRQLEKAEQCLDHLRTIQPDNIAVWAYSDILWRLIGDNRHQWLHKQDGLTQEHSLQIDDAILSEIADYLRNVHVSHSAPLGQSLRGGTQTRGRLLRRNHPAITKLKEVIENTVITYWAGLGNRNQTHPLLKHRTKTPVIEGSWSVRLAEQGYHINHFHPSGILSSACYVITPKECDDCDNMPGWLELGRPPRELGLDLEPLLSVQPEPGKMVLFPSTLFHGTRPFGSGERLSVAFDVLAQ